MTDFLDQLVSLSSLPMNEREGYLELALILEPELEQDRSLGWFRQAESVASHLAETGEIPSRIGSVRKGDIGRWLNTQRELLNNGSLDRRKRLILDNVAPGWDRVTSSNRVVNSIRRIEDVSQFRSQNKRMPSPKSRIESERSCAESLSVLRAEYVQGRITAEESALADAMIRGWRRGLTASRP